MEVINISKNIIKLGNKILRQKSIPWTREELKDTKKIESLLDSMVKEMKASTGTGIAAPQIGINKQLFLFELPGRSQNLQCPDFPLTAFFNPRIELIDQDVLKPTRRINNNSLTSKFLHSSEKLLNLSQYKTIEQTEKQTTPTIVTPNNTIIMWESCLSVPNIFAKVPRARKCIIKFLDISGTERIIEADGIISACLQHEYDHLLGKMFIDRLDKNTITNDLVYTTEMLDDQLQDIFKHTGDFQIVK